MVKRKQQRKLLREEQGGKVLYRWQDVPAIPFLLRLLPWLNVALLTGAGGGVALVIWLSLQTLLNPDAGFWLQQLGASQPIPSSAAPDTTPQTLEQIQAGLQAQGQRLGATNFLTPSGELTLMPQRATTILIPVLAPVSPKNPSGTGIQEIRLYQALNIPAPLSWFQANTYWRLQQRVRLQGPTASQVMAATYDPRLSGFGSTTPLPLGQFLPYPNPTGGIGQWFAVGGSLSQGGATGTYGALFYFDSNLGRLQQQLVWSSPQGIAPQWQEITGGGRPELVISHGVGLEPDFQVYQLDISDRGAPQLQLIRLQQPQFNHPRYLKAMNLAKAGLWVQAQAELVPIQTNLKRMPAAQAQFDVIVYHARITQAQAQQATISPSDRIVSLLINGDWEVAWQALEQNLSSSVEVRTFLQQDSGKLQQRLGATLAADPQQPAAMAWMALLLHAQQGQTEAKAWLGKRVAGGSQVHRRIEKVLNQV